MLIRAALISLAFVTTAHAEVVDVQPQGFEVRQSVEVAAPKAKVWAALGKPALWWSSDHSWSGQAKNLSIDMRACGKWIERLPGGGSAEHMRVIFVQPGEAVRFEGALGPLAFTGGAGHMAWALTEKDGKTTVTWTYDVGGYAKEGWADWAPKVDGVLGAQLGRLKTYVETGSAG
jgi:uncharacterized protein YndB with AHSA1/START domain